MANDIDFTEFNKLVAELDALLDDTKPIPEELAAKTAAEWREESIQRWRDMLEHPIRTYAPEEKAHFEATLALKENPIDLSTFVPTNPAQTVLVPPLVNGELDRALWEAGIPFECYDTHDAFCGLAPLSHDELQTALIDRFDTADGWLYVLPFTQQSVDAYMDGYIDPEKDAFWKAWHAWEQTLSPYHDFCDKQDIAQFGSIYG